MRHSFCAFIAMCFLTSDSTFGEENAPIPSKSSYTKVFVEVEIRGILAYSDKVITVSASKEGFVEFSDPKDTRKGKSVTGYTLDFSTSKDLQELAKVLNGRDVVLSGKSELRMLLPTQPPPGGTGGTGFTGGMAGGFGFPQPLQPTWYLHPTVIVNGLKSPPNK